MSNLAVKIATQLLIQCAGVICTYILAVVGAKAQVTSDSTLSTTIQTAEGMFLVTGGQQVGGNLFHSFSSFSVPEQSAVIFENGISVQRIVARITGNSVSRIDGQLQNRGNASLILLNPSGVIFGPTATLQLGGSFLATTAADIIFADGTSFGVSDPQSQPLLTVSTPTGLQFGANPGRITIDQPTAVTSPPSQTAGLAVLPGNTVALIGGDILLQAGEIVAPGGRIEIGSVADGSFVEISSTDTGWTLGYTHADQFQDIQLSRFTLNTNGVGSGPIQLFGRQIHIADDSGVSSINFGTEVGGNISVNASELVAVKTGSGLGTFSLSSGLQEISLSILSN